MAFDVLVRRRRVAIDLSPADGGDGAGFSPAELFAGAFGSCIAAAVQGYCDSSGFSDGDVSVSLAFESQGKRKRVGAISVDVDLPATVPEDLRDEVRAVAEQAALCETLKHPPEIDIAVLFQHQVRPCLDHVGVMES